MKNSEEETTKEKATQLDLGMHSGRFEIFYKVKRCITNIEKRFLALPQWRNGFIWTAIVTMVASTILNGLALAMHYTQLPDEIPLVFSYHNNAWELYPKEYILAVPVVMTVIALITIRIVQNTYYMNKKLTQMICIIFTVSYILEFIGINEIIILSMK